MTSEPLTWATIQPHYAAYCIAHEAVSPQEMMDRDVLAYPGGRMAGFIAWMTERRAAWQKETGRKEGVLLSEADRAEFGAWLFTETVRRRSAGPRFAFVDGVTEITDGPSIMRDDPRGGDPHLVAVVSRIHRPEALQRLCALANAALTFEDVA